MRRKSRELVAIMIVSLLGIAPIRARAQATGNAGSPIASFARSGADAAENAQSRTDHAKRRITLTLRQVTVKEALRAIARQADVRLMYNDNDLPADQKVTVTISDATVDEALAMVLRGTGLIARRTESGIVVEQGAPRETSEREVVDGSLSGVVTDAATGQPIAGVSLRLEGTSLAASSGSDGVYRFAAVPAGAYTLAARQVGYEKITTSVDIDDGAEQRKDLAMSRTPTILDQVVTTGTVVPTEVKALPTPISVVTAEQIEQQQAFTIMGIIRQAVPTAVAHDAPNVPANTDVSVRGASSLTGTGNMKIFIDGVETSSTGNVPVDPSSIDRIEIVRGPQAATLYGADAAGGVIQIFTKRGDSSQVRPRAIIRTAVGITQTPYEGLDNAVRQRYSANISGGAPNTTYRFGGSYECLAEYVPDNGQTRQSTSGVYGSMNLSRRLFSMDLSGRYHRNTIPLAFNPEIYASGYVPLSKPQYARGDFINQTYGIRIALSPTNWLKHNLSLGIDRLTLDNVQTQPRLTTAIDTLLTLTSIDSRKASAGYNVTAFGRLSEDLTGSLTLGIDHYVQVVRSMTASGALNTSGAIATVPPGGLSYSDNSVSNTGYFAQAQISMFDALFLVAGLRSEDNSTFGGDYGMATLPRVGLSYVQPVGDLTLKLRASYGESLRTPGPSRAAGVVTASAIQLANPELAPEKQRGWDGGIDLVFGSQGSLSVSGFDQTAIDLIAFLQVASSPLPTYQYRNVGRVSNKGAGVEGTFNPAPWLALRAQYGYVRSRVMAVGAAGGQVEAGDRPIGVPTHTAGAAFTIIPHQGTTLNAGVTYVGSFRNTDILGELRCLATFASPECPESFLNTFSFRDFITSYPGFAKFNASIKHDFRTNIALFVNVDNLTNKKAFEFDNSSPIVGRTTMLGFEVSY